MCIRRWVEHDFPQCSHYDEPDAQDVPGLKDDCSFCEIAAGASEPLLYEDEHCAIF